MITITPKHWLFFMCLLASVVLVYLSLRVVILDEERRGFAIFMLGLASCGGAWGTWAHVRTQARIERLEQALAAHRATQREALVLSMASRSKGNLTSVDGERGV